MTAQIQSIAPVTRRLTINITLEISMVEDKIQMMLKEFPEMLDSFWEDDPDTTVLSAWGSILDRQDAVAEYSYWQGEIDNEDPVREVQIADQDHLIRLGYKI